MARREVRTFKDIQDAVMEMMKVQSTDNVSRERIKRDINAAYVQEVLAAKRWPWKQKSVNLQHQAAFSTGTASVTIGSVTVTLSETPTQSYQDQSFTVDNQPETYRVLAHSANSNIITLDVPYCQATATGVKFHIWKDHLDLPTDLYDIIEVKSPYMPKPLTMVGLTEYRRIQVMNAKAEGRPQWGHLTDFVDPNPYESIAGFPISTFRSSERQVKTLTFAASTGLVVGDRIKVSGAANYAYNQEAIVSSVSTTLLNNDTITYTSTIDFTEATTATGSITVQKLANETYDRRRQLFIYPAILNTVSTMTIDYVIEAPPLEFDADEPIIPVQDRQMLVWFGLSYAMARERMTDDALQYRNMAETRLMRLMGSTDSNTDKPLLVMSRTYLQGKRRRDGRRNINSGAGFFDGDWGGSGGAQNPSGTPDQVAVFGPDGLLQSSGVITVDELNSLNNITGNVELRLNALGLPPGSVGGQILQSSFDSPPAIIESGVDATVLPWLIGAAGFTTFALADNQAVPSTVATWPVASIDQLVIDYSIKRGSGVSENGQIRLTSEGTVAGIATWAAGTSGGAGVSFSADVSGTDLRLLYTSTSTGTAPAMKYKLYSWLG